MTESELQEKQKKIIKPKPHSKEAEEAVLGCILTDSKTFNIAAEYIKMPEMFYYDDHQAIWKIMVKMHQNHEEIDLITVSAKFTADQNENISSYYLSGLHESVPSVTMITQYARIVAEKYLQRKLINVTYEVQKSAFDNSKETNSLLEDFKKHTIELQELQPGRKFDLEETLEDAIISIKESKNLINYGYDVLDSMAGGMTRGEITIIAGRPGHGKTTFAVNLIPKLINQGLKVMIVNREMTNKEMSKKLIVLEGKTLSYRTIRTGEIDKQTDGIIKNIKKKIIKKYTDNLIMYDDIKDLNSTLSQIQKEKPDVVIDDYIQLIKTKGHTERRFELENIMQDYKWIAKSMKIVPILVSQLNRAIEQRIDPIPKMSDLAESGSIEQVAENILFTYYDYKVNYNLSEFGKYRTQIIAAKVRYGETGMTTLGFDGDKVKFYESPGSVIIKEQKETVGKNKKAGITNGEPF